MNAIFDSSHLLGVSRVLMHSLYKSVRRGLSIAIPCCSRMGWMLSGPGDLNGLKDFMN